MKPYQNIKELTKVIEELKYEHKYAKNKTKSAKRINVLISVLNSFDSMLVSKYKTDAIDSLLVYLFRDYLMRYYIQSDNVFVDGLPLYEILDKVDFCLKRTSNENIEFLAGDIVTYLIESEVYKYEKNYINSDKTFKNIHSIADKKEVVFLIKDLFKQIKQHIVWN